MKWDKFFILTASLIVCFAVDVRAQVDTTPHQGTQILENSRYEIVQSALAARWTFRVDKYTGQVYQIVQATDEELVWEEMPKIAHPLSDTQKSNQVNYQLFISGTLARLTLLMNVNTGATWQIKQDSETDIIFWDPLK